jgi:tetratricopeptide (TPR) repeat protein
MTSRSQPGDEARRIAGEEGARRRIAREIHDDHCQRLAALALGVRAVRRTLPDGDPRRRELDAVGADLAELSDDLRDLSHDLHPALLERLGLAATLRDQCEEVEHRHGLEVWQSLPGAEMLFPPEVALGLYRIAQEALANTVRHAGARRVEVTLCAVAGEAQLTVADDGAGFAPGAARRASGLGLASIEERARLLGGRCHIRSAPGSGTTIEVVVPLPASELRELRRLVRRHRGFLVSAALVILALAVGLVATAREARRAEQESIRADAVARFLEELFRAADPRQARGTLPDARKLLERGAERLGRELSDQPLLRARLLDTLGGIDTELGLYDEARPLLQEALALRERLHPEDVEVAETLVRLGALAHLSGKGDAVPLFKRALALREARLGTESPEVADILNQLGAALAAKGRFDEAETALRRTLALQERLWGKGDLRVAKSLHNLSGIALYRNRTDEAGRLLERALAIREAALPADDLDLAGSREALALLRQKQGRPAEAVALLERLAATLETVYGPVHPNLGKTLLNLALARASLGEDAAAQKLLERALAIDEKALAPDHPQLVRALATLADFDFEHGRYAEAEPLYRRLLALRAAGASYEGWDRTLPNWPRLLSATGRPEEAARALAPAPVEGTSTARP